MVRLHLTEIKWELLNIMPPELTIQATLKASDYYSFGQTLWTLYSGRMMYGDIIQMYKSAGVEEQCNQVNFAMLQNTYYGLEEISKDFEFFEVLIRGLLLYDTTSRFNYQQVKRWIEGDKSLANDIPNYDGIGGEKPFSIALDLWGHKCWNNEDIAKALCTDLNKAIDILYEGNLELFCTSQNFNDGVFIKEIKKKYSLIYSGKHKDYMNNVGLAKVILCFSKNKILCWKGIIFKKYTDISNVFENINNYEVEKMDYYGLIRSELILEWYKSGKKPDNKVISNIEKIRKLAGGDLFSVTTAYYWTMYLFTDDIKKLSISNCRNVDEYIDFIFETKSKIYDNNTINDSCLMGILCAWGYFEYVNVFLKSTSLSKSNRYGLLFSLLEKVASNKMKPKVRKAYYDCGPQSYLNWWKDNIDIYQFNGNSTLLIKDEIENAKTDETASIRSQEEYNKNLFLISQEFLTFFEADYSMCSIGIYSVSEKYISSKSLNGSWYFDFLGNPAPVGFRNYIGITEKNSINMRYLNNSLHKANEKVHDLSETLMNDYNDFINSNPYYKGEDFVNKKSSFTLKTLFWLLILIVRNILLKNPDIALNKIENEKIHNVIELVISSPIFLILLIVIIGIYGYNTLKSVYCYRLQSYKNQIEKIETIAKERINYLSDKEFVYQFQNAFLNGEDIEIKQTNDLYYCNNNFCNNHSSD